MKIRLIVSSIILTLMSFLCACSNKNTNKDRRCPALVEKAEYYKSKSINGYVEGPNGMMMSVEYIDTVYRIIQVIDEKIIPVEKVNMFLGSMKQNMIATVSSSSGPERNDYQQMVDYRVTFEHVVKNKNTGKIIVRNTMTPDEIAEALEKKLTPQDELQMYVKTQKGTLPRIIEEGYTMKDISISDDVVYIVILINEDKKEFDEATKLKTWPKAEQAVTLADQTTGLTFWSVAAQVPVEFDFHFIGSKDKNDLHLRFSKDEVVQYNEVMERIKRSTI